MKFSLILLLSTLVLAPFTGKCQTSVDEMIKAKKFIFEAESMTPLKGQFRTLTPGYTLKVSPDTVSADLPYVGRAFQAKYGSSDGGIKFQATKFEYTLKEKKKGLTATIVTKEISGSPRVIVDVYSNGRARVVVTSADRDSITFNGTIKQD